MARIAFLGSKRIGLRVFGCLLDAVAPPHVIAGVIRPDDRAERRSELPAFERLTAANQLPLAVTRRMEDAWTEVARLAPDIVIVCGWYRAIPLHRFPGTESTGCTRHRSRATGARRPSCGRSSTASARSV